ncbi:hypothetical protein D3C78_821100 [compost metagenome]
MAAGNPLKRVDVAQTARAAFDIRLKVIAGAVIALVAHILFFDLGGKEFFGRPEAFAENVLLQFKKQCHVANQQTCFDQIGGDGQIG